MKISFQIEGATPAELAEIVQRLGLPLVPRPAAPGAQGPGADVQDARRERALEKLEAAEKSHTQGQEAPPRSAQVVAPAAGNGSVSQGAAATAGRQPESAAPTTGGSPPPGETRERAPGEDDDEVDTGDEVFFRCGTVKSAVKVLVDRGVRRRADLVEKARDLRGQGVPVWEAVPEDQIEDRVRSALIGLGLPEEP